MLEQYLIVFGFFIVAISLMLLSLHFSKYKKNSEGCCGGLHCETNGSKNSSQKCSKDFSESDSLISVEKVKL